MKVDCRPCNIEMSDSYLNRISSFMKWAHEKISKEIEKNEELEQEFGTAKYQSENKLRTHTHLDHREKMLVVDEIDRFRGEGDKVYCACEKVGIHPQTYYKWRKNK